MGMISRHTIKLVCDGAHRRKRSSTFSDASYGSCAKIAREAGWFIDMKRRGANGGVGLTTCPTHSVEVGDEVVEDEKRNHHLFVEAIDRGRIMMAWTRGGTIAVQATLEDFPVYFSKVKKTSDKRNGRKE
jgi:hypothetical protein